MTRPVPERPGRLVPLAAMFLGIGLVAIALPHTIAGLGVVPAMPVLEGLRKGERVTDAYLRVAVEAGQQALAWSPDAQTWADLGLVRWEQARRDGLVTDTAIANLEASAVAVDRSLAMAPSMGLVWARRAQIELARNGLSPAFEQSLVLSLETAPFDPTVLWPRLDLALLAWPILTDETRTLVVPQIVAAADLDPLRLAGLAHRRYALAPIREALERDSTRLAGFERARERLR